jgi:hypothetical protein
LIRGRGDSAGAAGREREERERAGLCFFLRADDGEKKKRGATVLVCLPSLLVFGG